MALLKVEHPIFRAAMQLIVGVRQGHPKDALESYADRLEHLIAELDVRPESQRLYAGHAVGDQPDHSGDHQHAPLPEPSDPRAAQWTAEEQAEFAARNSPPMDLRNLLVAGVNRLYDPSFATGGVHSLEVSGGHLRLKAPAGLAEHVEMERQAHADIDKVSGLDRLG